MNPLTNMKNVLKLSEQELRNPSSISWHDQYNTSAWIFIGGLPYDLTEGDIICIFSQYGEVVNINLVRDKATGKQKGFCFLCYEDQRSTILAVDNLNGIKVNINATMLGPIFIRILNRTIRIDHVQDYKTPKESKNMTVETAKLLQEGCANKILSSEDSGQAKIKQEPEELRIKTEPDLKKVKIEQLSPKSLKNASRKSDKDFSIKVKKECTNQSFTRKKHKKESHHKRRKDTKEKVKKKKKRRSPSTSSSTTDSSSTLSTS